MPLTQLGQNAYLTVTVSSLLGGTTPATITLTETLKVPAVVFVGGAIASSSDYTLSASGGSITFTNTLATLYGFGAGETVAVVVLGIRR